MGQPVGAGQVKEAGQASLLDRCERIDGLDDVEDINASLSFELRGSFDRDRS